MCYNLENNDNDFWMILDFDEVIYKSGHSLLNPNNFVLGTYNKYYLIFLIVYFSLKFCENSNLKMQWFIYLLN